MAIYFAESAEGFAFKRLTDRKLPVEKPGNVPFSVGTKNDWHLIDRNVSP